VIREIDIWRVPNLMLKCSGDNAGAEGARRADEFAANGDDAGVAVWRCCPFLFPIAGSGAGSSVPDGDGPDRHFLRFLTHSADQRKENSLAGIVILAITGANSGMFKLLSTLTMVPATNCSSLTALLLLSQF
jgi:hypothetical protein